MASTTIRRLENQNTPNVPHMNIITSFVKKEPSSNAWRVVMSPFANFCILKRNMWYNLRIKLNHEGPDYFMHPIV